MTWVRIDDHAMSHPRLLRAGAEAVALWLAGLCHCNAHTTDGRIEKDMIPLLYPPLGGRSSAASKKLIDLGLWIEDSDAVLVHDYAHYQEEALKKNVEARRAQARDRQQKKREQERVSRPVSQRDSMRDIAQTPAVTHGDVHPMSRLPVRASPVPAIPVPAIPDEDEDSATALRARVWLRDAAGADFDHGGKFRRAFLILAKKPEPEILRAAATFAASAYVRANPRSMHPQHVLDYWDDYASGNEPGRKGASGAATVSPASEHNEPEPTWLTQAKAAP